MWKGVIHHREEEEEVDGEKGKLEQVSTNIGMKYGEALIPLLFQQRSARSHGSFRQKLCGRAKCLQLS